jgi:L-ascorbate metabolism protein UlaG (beta-lactamase superfamily)
MKSKQDGVKIIWYGHSAFLFESIKGNRILIDPWLDNPKAPAGVKDIVDVDLILITHGHSDHIGNTVEIAKRTNAKVIAIYEVYLHILGQGIKNAQGMNKGGTIEFENIKVTMVDARHSSGIDFEEIVISGGDAAGYVVEFENGFKIYHAGDTALFGDMKIIGDYYKPDLALLPIGGLYTMGPKETAIACQFLRPMHIIGMHYGTFPVLTGSPAELRDFLSANWKKKVIELEVGKELMF